MQSVVNAAQRLRASPVQDLINSVEKVTKKYGIKRIQRNFPNPREYRKPVPPPYLDDVQKEFESMGFKFKKLPIHKLDTQAVEAEGSYKSVDYILDLIINHDELEIDLYY